MNSVALDIDRATYLVLTKQHLTTDSKSADIVQVVRDVGGLHATLGTTPYLSLFARSTRFKKLDLDDELYTRRTLGKIRCVRRTIYVHTRDMIPVALAATGKMVTSASRRYMESSGTSPEEYDRISRAILELLKSKEMTASAIRQAVKTEGDISSILYYMCDQGLLIRSKPEKSWRDRTHAYAVFREHFPDIELGTLSEPEAIVALVRQYLASFGPVTENDIIWWTGLGKRKVRRSLASLENLLAKVTITGLGSDLLLLKSDEALAGQVEIPNNPTVNLLPSLDPYLMGYKERARYLDESDQNYVFDRSGNATSTILANGRIIGVWDVEQRSGDAMEPVVKLFFFRDISPRVLDEIRTQARDVGHFITGSEVQVRECNTMVPLTLRSAGSMMTPLKGCQ
jgi:hypothetical protein